MGISVASDGAGPPQPGGSGIRRTLDGVMASLSRGGHAAAASVIVRLCKYAVLVCGAALTLIIVFDAYSFYVARRDIDAELRSKGTFSLEYIGVLAQRKRALAITSLQGRCLERTQLTLFRILDGQHDRIKSVYGDLIQVKNKMLAAIERLGPGYFDVAKAQHFINYQQFSLADLDQYIEPSSPTLGANEKYKAFRTEIGKLRDQYDAIAMANAPLRDDVEKLITDSPRAASKYWNMDEIEKVARRNEQVRTELDAVKKQMGNIEEVIARYGVWTGALTGGAANNPVLDEIGYQIEKNDLETLASADCSAFEDYYKAVNNRILRFDPMAAKVWQELTWSEKVASIPRYYRRALVTYFNQPPAAQTLFVTMFLGALGAFTLNILRMSKVGWWSLQDDPLWGEIIVGPLLGALAAFGIFLLGSTGLLLTSENSGSQPLSAYFIGLLGFLSGLLYDEAFGRVRRVGQQMFAEKEGEDQANVRAEDRSLAEALRGNSAAQAASLAIKYGIGTRLSLESEFTLLIPSDEAMGRLTMATWTMLNDAQTGMFEKWYHHHHAPKRVGRQDVAATVPPINELSVDDGTTYPLAASDGEFRIGGVRVLIADVKWKKGVIHVLSEDLAAS
jgi:hypothetical protein